MRRLHGAGRWQGGPFLRHADQRGSQKRDHDDRRPRLAKQAAPAATGLHRRAGHPVRLLHQRHDYVGERVARPQPATERARRARGARWQPLPLRYASSHYSRGAAGGAGKREDTNVNGPAFDRRKFAIGLGAIVVAFSLDPRHARGQERLPGSLENNRRLDGWIRINADGSATIFTGKVELGQGILTALAQIAAEELDLPLSRVKMISGDTGQTPNEGQTAGSQSIENSGTALRMAGAEVRAILIDLAAQRLGVPADQLTVAEGTIVAPDGRKVGYGDLNPELNREASAKAAPKPAAAHKIVGRSISRFDIPAKVTGGAAYVQDIRLPGMLHGRVIRPPRYGSKLDTVDKAAARAMPGVVAVVRDGSFLGVVAEREEQAIGARAALLKSAKWTLGPELPDPARLFDVIRSLPSKDATIGVKEGAAPANARTL